MKHAKSALEGFKALGEGCEVSSFLGVWSVLRV